MDQVKARQLITENIKNLPTLPDVVQKLITLLQDEKERLFFAASTRFL